MPCEEAESQPPVRQPPIVVPQTPSLPVRLPCQTCLPPRPVVRHGASRAPERGVLVRRWSKHGSTSRITWYAIAITAAFDRNS